MTSERHIIERSFGDPNLPDGVEVEAEVAFTWNELQRLVIQSAVDRQPPYAGMWNGKAHFKTSDDPPGVTATVEIWKEPEASKRD